MLFGLALLFIISFIFPILYNIAIIFLIAFLFVLTFDVILLFKHKAPVSAHRTAKYKYLSNGDENELNLNIQSFYGFNVNISVIDELPEQFQIRNFLINSKFLKGEIKTFKYTLKPFERGEYHFRKINLFIKSPVLLIERHIKIEQNFMMACYPSFLKIRQYELLAINNRLTESGIKKIRRVGHSREFEQIKEYVIGDEPRFINWKATARRANIMVNHFYDERSQQVYNIIDAGRIMKMPFNNLSLLDYSINTSLMLGHVAWAKHDKPGLLLFSNKINTHVNADRKGKQLLLLQEALYSTKTNFEESNYEVLLSHIRRKITQRSLIILYTNFESLSGLKRQINYLRKIASLHLLAVVFFENTELKELLSSKPDTTFQIYEQTIAQKFEFEKRQIIKELQQYGIITIYTAPENLTVNAFNKYLEIKTRGLI
ncbi:MAG: DUF58 domain-containing protein [Bacteroidetes bacterium]|nr:DUF58 domain-containing protein [Bacteroidota bacterium]